VIGGGAGCAAVLAPSVRLALGPAQGGPEVPRWIPTVRFETLSHGVPKRVPVVADRHDAWTLEKSVPLGEVWLLRVMNEVKAWSADCPHLGCAVDLRENGPGFYCPCHDSSFDHIGRRVTGPSPRDLDSLETRIADSMVLVEFRRFRRGTAAKVPVG